LPQRIKSLDIGNVANAAGGRAARLGVYQSVMDITNSVSNIPVSGCMLQQEHKYTIASIRCLRISPHSHSLSRPSFTVLNSSDAHHNSLSTMKLTLLSLALISVTLAAPAPAAGAEAFPLEELLTSNLTPEAYALSKRQYSSSSYNQLTDGTACRAISVIYARGTSQQGNVGDAAAVGPLFFNQIASRVGGVSQLAIQGVTYSASVSGFLAGGDATGSTTMTNLISTVSSIGLTLFM
jgi:hypothetical protein